MLLFPPFRLFNHAQNPQIETTNNPQQKEKQEQHRAKQNLQCLRDASHRNNKHSSIIGNKRLHLKAKIDNTVDMGTAVMAMGFTVGPR